jgi:UDP-hydrolysing UDP-N-acetyl-D-glucosamine 2-epimerase
LYSHKHIGVFTGNRAEYGLLVPLLRALQAHSRLNPQLLVAQDHWLSGTIAEIKADGFNPTLCLPPPDASTLPTAPGPRMTVLSAHLLQQLATQLPALNLSALVILGDRFEAAACALAAHLLDIPILHVGGGDYTEGGCVDDALRHSISHLARWHAVASQRSAARLRAMGLPDAAIKVTGSLVTDTLQQVRLTPKIDLYAELGLTPDLPLVLFTQHPIACEGPGSTDYFEASLKALLKLPVQILATYPNQDAYAEAWQAVITRYQNRPDLFWHPSLGHVRYLSAMAHCAAVAGNTSSGLIETAFFPVASVTIGPRQQGRERGKNVLSCPYGEDAVYTTLHQAVFDKAWRTNALQGFVNPFGQQPAVPRIVDWLHAELGAF